jgi:hypothetical protein
MQRICSFNGPPLNALRSGCQRACCPPQENGMRTPRHPGALYLQESTASGRCAAVAVFIALPAAHVNALLLHALPQCPVL